MKFSSGRQSKTYLLKGLNSTLCSSKITLDSVSMTPTSPMIETRFPYGNLL